MKTTKLLALSASFAIGLAPTGQAATVLAPQAIPQDAYGVNLGAQAGVNFNTNTLNWSGNGASSAVYIGLGKSLVPDGYSGLTVTLNIEKTPAFGGGLIDFSSGYTFEVITQSGSPNGLDETTASANLINHSGTFFTYTQLGSMYESWRATAPVNSFFSFEIVKTSSGQEQGWSGDPINNPLVDPTAGPSFGGNQASVSVTAAVPEPSAVLLGSFGLLALIRRRR